TPAAAPPTVRPRWPETARARKGPARARPGRAPRRHPAAPVQRPRRGATPATGKSAIGCAVGLPLARTPSEPVGSPICFFLAKDRVRSLAPAQKPVTLAQSAERAGANESPRKSHWIRGR